MSSEVNRCHRLEPSDGRAGEADRSGDPEALTSSCRLMPTRGAAASVAAERDWTTCLPRSRHAPGHGPAAAAGRSWPHAIAGANPALFPTRPPDAFALVDTLPTSDTTPRAAEQARRPLRRRVGAAPQPKRPARSGSTTSTKAKRWKPRSRVTMRLTPSSRMRTAVWRPWRRVPRASGPRRATPRGPSCGAPCRSTGARLGSAAGLL